MTNPIFSLVIPVYNSEASLIELHDRIAEIMLKISASYEIILVDDYSTDDSWKKLQTLHGSDNRVKIIHLQKNFGQANAILCGFTYANGEYIITLDDDLQHPPEEIPKLVNKIKEGFFVVYGQFIIKHHSRIENFFSYLYQILKRHILDLPQGTNTSNFAIYTSGVIKNMVQINSSYVFLPALVQSSAPGNKIANVDVIHHPRKYGKSNYNIRKYIQHSLNLIINYSALPLRFIGIVGIFAGICSFIYGIDILGRYLLDPKQGVVGWNSIMVSLTFLGGLILFSMAIIGEYLRRILTEVSHGQKFVIADMEL
jgi:glycosyltransferase involved in cell wall biosynthesis